MDRHAITERYRSPSVNQDVTFCHHAGRARCVRENGEALSQGFGRVALVSGGSRAIVAATVRGLAAAGWDISFCHPHDERAAVETEQAASELGARVLAVQADLTAPAEVTAWARRAEEDLGPVQAVVSCAGITRDRPLALLTDADWRAVTDTGLDGVFHLCRAVLPAMMERQSGRIVAVSSISAVYGHATVDAARAGIAGFIRALASQTRRYGIRANAVTPAAHAGRTDMTTIWPEGTTAPLTEAIALRRFASAAEAADRVAFLLSDAAADVTGTVVEVPGGISLTLAGLDPVERPGEAERPAHLGPVPGQHPDLENRLPLGHRRGDLVLPAQPEPEPPVVPGVADQRHQRLAERVARAQHRVHQRAAHPGPLPVRPHGQRAQRQHRRVADVPPRAQHVPGHLAAGLDRHQRQRRDPGRAVPELVDQRGLGRDAARPRRGLGRNAARPRERGRRDGPDRPGVARRFPSDQHRFTLSAAGPPRNRIRQRRSPSTSLTRGQTRQLTHPFGIALITLRSRRL
jgi:3-oxoacyl-[acyl-carrier protein] reductase